MRVPPKIKIKRGVAYEIVWQEIIKDDPECLGLCDPNTKQIHLKIGQSKTELAKTVIHETLHALAMEHEFDLPHRTVYALESAIFKTLKLNKWL